MIKYTLKCAQGHAFDSWFASADAFEGLRKARHLSCVTCGSSQVEKAVMTPRVATSKARRPEAPTSDGSVPQKVEAALSKMRDDVEKNADYVGRDFASTARDMHLGEVPEKPIWGEANAKEAKALIEDGVPVAPLPFIPRRKVN